MKSFTLIESMIAVALIVMVIAIATASYKRAKWTAKVADHAMQNRGRLNQAVAEGKFKSQKKFDEERARLKRQTEIGLKQGH